MNKKKNRKKAGFKKLLKKYVELKTIVILLYLYDGQTISLGRDRKIVRGKIITFQDESKLEIP